MEGRGEGEREGKRGELGRAWGSRMVEMEEGWIWEQGRRYLNQGSHFRVGRRLVSRGYSRCPRRCSQVGPWAAEERVPELALSHSHTDEYLEYHHRTFIWQWMEIETETHIRSLD